MCVCPFVCPFVCHTFVCPPGDKHFPHTVGGGGQTFFTDRGGQTFYVGGGGAYDDVDEEVDVSKANNLVGPEILVPLQFVYIIIGSQVTPSLIS